jgi:hypothetical protein
MSALGLILFVVGALFQSLAIIVMSRFDDGLRSQERGVPAPFASDVFRVSVLLVVVFVATLVWWIASCNVTVPGFMSGWNLHALLGMLFAYCGFSLWSGSRRTARLLQQRRLVAAVTQWAAIRACMAFEIAWIVVIWATANVLLVMERGMLLSWAFVSEVTARACHVVDTILPSDFGLTKALHSAAKWANGSDDSRFIVRFIGVTALVYVTLIVLRAIRSSFRELRGPDRVPRSPGRLLVVTGCLTLVATALFLLAAYPFLVIGVTETHFLQPVRKHAWPVLWLFAFLVSIGIIGVLVYSWYRWLETRAQGSADPAKTTDKAGRRCLSIWPPEEISRVSWAFLCVCAAVCSTWLWFSAAADGKYLCELAKRLHPSEGHRYVVGDIPAFPLTVTKAGDLGTGSLLYTVSSGTITGTVADVKEASLSNRLSSETNTPGERLKQCRVMQSSNRAAYPCSAKLNTHPYLRLVSVASMAWLLALCIMGFYLMPHSFVDDMSAAGRRRRDWNGLARVKCLAFLGQCIVENPVSFVAGGVLHVVASFLPLMCCRNYFGLSPESYGPSLYALWYTSLPMFIGPVCIAYLNQRGHFGRGVARRLGGRLLNQLQDHTVLIGFGNLGESILSKRMKSMAQGLSFSLSNDFAVVVDHDGIVRPVCLQVAALDRDPAVFTQVFGADSLWRVGTVSARRNVFINASDQLPLSDGVAEEPNVADRGLASRFPERGDTLDEPEDDLIQIQFIGVCADAMTEYSLQSVCCSRARNVVVALDDDGAVVAVQQRLSRLDGPGQVVKLDSGSLFRRLSHERFMLGLYPRAVLLYPPPDEAENFVRFLNVFPAPSGQKMAEAACPAKDGENATPAKSGEITNSTKPHEDTYFIIVGGGRRIIYLLRALASELGFQKIGFDEWVKDHVLLVTTDKYIGDSLHRPDAQRSSANSGNDIWRLYLRRAIPDAKPVEIQTRYTSRVEYDAFRAELTARLIKDKGSRLNVIVFGDQDPALMSVVTDVIRDVSVNAEYGNRITLCASVLAHEEADRLDRAERLSQAHRQIVPVKRVVHDEVIAAEATSCLDTLRAIPKESGYGDNWSLHVCENGHPGSLLWKTLVLGGVNPKIATAELDAMMYRMKNVKIPSWHYFFTESGLTVADGSRSPQVGFRFRSGIRMCEPKWEHDVRAVSAVNWSTGLHDSIGSVWGATLCHTHPEFAKKRSFEQCSTLCPCIMNADLAGQMDTCKTQDCAKNTCSPNAGPTVGSIDVICGGFDKIGTFARMLGTLMLQDWAIRSFEVTPPELQQRVLDIRFIKSNEFCGPGYSLCTIHGQEIVLPVKERNINESVMDSDPMIARVEIEGSNEEIRDYWKKLAGHFEQLWPGRYRRDVGDRMVLTRMPKPSERVPWCGRWCGLRPSSRPDSGIIQG